MQRYSTLDICAGMPLGLDPCRAALAAPSPMMSGHWALDSAVADALAHPPCGVAFSGGYDSSLLLAVATRIARERGLDPPIPVTARFPRVADAGEDDWQELVIDHLGLRRHWVLLETNDELEFAGDLSLEYVRAASGVCWPPNGHFLLLICRALGKGGTLLTGGGGDEIFSRPGWGRYLALRRGVRPTSARAWAAVAAPFLPYPVRAAACFATMGHSREWLRSRTDRLVRWREAEAAALAPVGWDRALREWLWRSRYLDGLLRLAALVNRVTAVTVRQPLVEPIVLRAVGNLFGSAGPRSRRQAIRLLAGEWLPEALFQRAGKATFNGAFWGERTHRFARSAVDDLPSQLAELVDRERLRALWAEDAAHAGTWWLLQSVLAVRELS